jgi:heat shock protein 5
MKDAGAVAGLQVLRVINEPTSAAIAYDINQLGGERWTLVVDIGARSTDVTILNVDDGVFEIIATTGDYNLGGDDYNQRIVGYLYSIYQDTVGRYALDHANYVKGLLVRHAEHAKLALTTMNNVTISVSAGESLPILRKTLTRTMFEDLNQDLFMKTLHFIDDVLRQANITKEEVDDVSVVLSQRSSLSKRRMCCLYR